MWERAATGFSLSYSQDLGYFGGRGNPVPLSEHVSDRQLRLELFALARVTDRLTLSVLVPTVGNFRSSNALAQQDGGLGDVAVGMRWDLLTFDRSSQMGVAIVSSVSLPTGRDPNRVRTALAVDSTGKGTAVVSLGVSAELPLTPWFLRLDLLTSVPVPTSSGAWLSPTIDLTFTTGVRLVEMLFVSANARANVQLPTAQQAVGYDLSVGASIVLRPDPQWSLLLGVSSSLFLQGFGLNRSAPVSTSLGLRYAAW